MRRDSIRTRLLLGMTAVLSMVVVLTAGVMEIVLRHFLEVELTSSLDRAQVAYQRFEDSRGAFLLDQARSLAQVPHLRALLGTPDVDPESFSFTLDTLRDVTSVPLIVLGDPQGSVLADTLPGSRAGESLRQLPELDAVLLGDGRRAVWHYGGSVFLAAATPVTISGTILGVVALGIPLDAAAADELHSVTGHDVTLLAGERVLGHSSSEAPPRVGPGTTRHDVLGDLALQPGRAVRGRLPSGDSMVCLIPLDQQTSLVLSRSVEQLTAPFRAAERNVILLGLGIAAVAFFVSNLLSSRLARPILALSRAADAFSEGDLSLKVEVQGTDEVSDLARSFHTMARRIEALVAETKKKAEAAEAASHAKSTFLSTMSHEVRTPLNGVLGLAEQLLESDLGSDVLMLAEGIYRSGLDLRRLLDDVLDFSLLESGRLKLDETEFHLPVALKRVIDPLLPALERKGLSFSLKVDEDVPQQLVGAVVRLQQVLRNLLANALEFTPAGAVSVHVTREGGSDVEPRLRFVVRDTGIGIRREDLTLIFRPFTQLDSSFSRKHGGAGLGLALSKDLVERLGGSMGVESVHGIGSTFWFCLPLRRAQARGAEPQAAATAPPPALPCSVPAAAAPPEPGDHAPWRARQRILIVEDNPVNQRVTSLVLHKAGWPHDVAADGASALDFLARQRYDLVLMDLQMPVMDGLEATRRIRGGENGLPASIPIVAVTANTTERDLEACQRAGMNQVVGKPLRAAALVEVMDAFLAPAPSA